VDHQQADRRRVVVKVGTNLLTAGSDRLDLGVMAGIVGQIVQLQAQGIQVAVVSSGAIAAGRHELGMGAEHRGVGVRQMLAAVGQNRLIAAWGELFRWHSIHVAQILLTRTDINRRASYLNARNTMLGLLDIGVVPVINENDVVGVDEIVETKFGDNDHLSALVAGMLDASLLAILTDAEGLFTADPGKDPGAVLIPRVELVDDAIEQMAGGSASGRGTGGMYTKVQAARLATLAGVEVVIMSGHQRGALVRAVAGEDVGTRFPAHGTHVEARKRWMLSGLGNRGAVHLDLGATRAVRDQGKSLLPAGITRVTGDFERGDTISLVGPDGSLLAYGMANYSAEAVRRIQGLRSSEIEDTLGYFYGQEVVHRDNRVLLEAVAAGRREP
jgi:glutamate 5-kinase